MKMSRSSCTVRFDVSRIRSAIARMALSFCRSSVIPSVTDRSGASGCGRRVSLNRRTSAEWLASRKISVGFTRGVRLQLPVDARKLRQEAALAHVDDDRHLVEARILARRQLGHRRNQLRRQVVDAEVAEVLERADRLRLARARQAGQDDEAARAARRRLAAALCFGLGPLDPSPSSHVAPVLDVLVGRRARLRRRRPPCSARSSRAARSRAAWRPRVRRAGCAPHLDQDRQAAAGRHRHPDQAAPQAEEVVDSSRRARADRTREPDPSARAGRRARPACSCASTRRRTGRGC